MPAELLPLMLSANSIQEGERSMKLKYGCKDSIKSPRVHVERWQPTQYEENETACLGGIDKWWLDRNGFVQREFFVFGKYANQAAFDSAVEGILQQAQTRAHDENLDFSSLSSIL